MTTSMRIDSPRTASEFANRDLLLAKTMRDAPLSWPYAAEYPIILAPESARSSFCVFIDDAVVAHTNIWLRELRHASGSDSHAIALMGNVTSHPDHRGQGHIRQLMTHAAEAALSQGANAIVLWSDLLQFYQNLGFTSNGRELRYSFARSDRPYESGIQKVDCQKLSDQELEAMLKRRPKLEWNLGRSVEEFRRLLSIPNCELFVRRKGAQILSWLAIGKGSDMAGVIHEWGASSPDELVADIRSLMHTYRVTELTLLVPGALQAHWHNSFKINAASTSTHYMALAKALNPKGEIALNHLARGFIWGFDSI